MQMKKNKQSLILRNSGFTLIEIILYVGIIAIIFAAIMSFALTVINNGSKSAVQQEVYSNARFISEKIKYEIRRASGITNVSANSITLTNLAPDSSTVIDLVSGKVQINKNDSGAINLNSDGTTISDLSFTNNTFVDNKTKNISFTLTVTANGVRQEYQSSISLRSSAEIRSN